jgi:hypothetical protein
MLTFGAVPPASSGSLLLEKSWTVPDLPAYFVDLSPENTRIVKQSCGNILTLGLSLGQAADAITSEE